MRKAVAVFAKEPVPGRVKTRLARTIGGREACSVYARLLDVTLGAVASVDAARYLFLPPGESYKLPEGFDLERQDGGDLGERMGRAFDVLFRRGYDRVVLIGSDCPYLDATRLEEAFERLKAHPCVLGPSPDGGFYLVGQCSPGVDLFHGIPWSTTGVWSATMKRLSRLGTSAAVLEAAEDVDDYESYRRWLRAMRRESGGGSG